MPAGVWHLAPAAGKKASQALQDSACGRTAEFSKQKHATQAVGILSLSSHYLSPWEPDGRIDPLFFQLQLSMIPLQTEWVSESTRRQFSVVLKAVHCWWRVFSVCQQQCLAAVALCLHKCSVWWGNLVEVTADSTERLLEKTHLLLNMQRNATMKRHTEKIKSVFFLQIWQSLVVYMNAILKIPSTINNSLLFQYL